MRKEDYFKKGFVMNARKIKELEEKNLTIRELNHLMFGKKRKK